MIDPQLACLQEHLCQLKLFTLQARLESLIQDASAQEVSAADFLDRALTEEVAAKSEKYVTMRTVMARFPSRKTLESFDFSFQSSMDRKKLRELAMSRSIEHGTIWCSWGCRALARPTWRLRWGLKRCSCAGT